MMYIKKILSLFFRILFANEAILLPENRSGRVKAAIIIAVPIIVQNLVRHFQVVIDRFFLGNLDPIFLSVIGNVNVPYGTLDLFIFATGTGLSVLTAHALGAGQPQKAKVLSESSFLYLTLMGALIFVFWQFFANSVFILLGANENLVTYAVTYVKILAVSALFLGIDVTSGSILSSIGITSPIMLTGILKNVLNLLLDWLLIFGNWGFPALGIEGAAWATVIANVTGTLVLFMVVLVNQKMPFKIQLWNIIKAPLISFLQTLRVGLPSGVETFLWFLGQTFVLSYMNALGEYAAGIYTLSHDIFMLALFVYIGFSRSTLTLVGQFWGAGRYKEAIHAGWEGQIISLIISAVWALILALLGGWLLSFFTTENYIIQEGAKLMQVASLFVIFQTFNVVIGNAIRATGDTLWMLWTQIFGTVFMIVVAPLFIFTFSLGLLGVMWALALDELIRGAVNALRFSLVVKPIRLPTIAKEKE